MKNPVEKIASNPVTSVAVMVFSALKMGILVCRLSSPTHLSRLEHCPTSSGECRSSGTLSWVLLKAHQKGGKDPHPRDFSLTKKTARFTKGQLRPSENGLATDTGRGLVVKRPGVLSKIQMLTLVLGVGVFSLLPKKGRFCKRAIFSECAFTPFSG